MTIENLSTEKPASISLEIPSSTDGHGFPSSAASSSPPSPTGILDPAPSSRNSTSSSNRSQNVTFAPLPDIAPRKRKSSAPLGMAARRQLADRRRQRMQHIQSGNPMWTDEEIEQQARRAGSTGSTGSAPREFTEDDDPFLVLGKLVKDAGKQLWKKVSNKDLKTKNTNGAAESNDIPPVPPLPTSTDSPDITRSATEVPREKDSESWTVLEHTISQPAGETELSNEKEDDYDSEFGTQTIVEGHTKYSWVKGKADELAAAHVSEQKIEIPPLPFEVSKPGIQAL